MLTDKKNICMCEVTRNLKAFANQHIRKMKPWIPESDVEATIVTLIRQGYKAFLSEARRQQCTKHAEKKCSCSCSNATLVYEDFEVLRRKTRRGATSPPCMCGKDADETCKVGSETQKILNSLESYMHLNRSFRMRLEHMNGQKLSATQNSIPTKIRRRNNNLCDGRASVSSLESQKASSIPKPVPWKGAVPRPNSSRPRPSAPVNNPQRNRFSNIPIKSSTPLKRTSPENEVSSAPTSLEYNSIASLNHCCAKHTLDYITSNSVRPKMIPKRSIVAAKPMGNTIAQLSDDTETAGSDTETSDVNEIADKVSGIQLTARDNGRPFIFSKIIETLKTDFHGVQEQWKNFRNNFNGNRNWAKWKIW